MSSSSPSGFTAHNVRLDDGTQTLPAVGATMDQMADYRCVKNMLQVVYPGGFAGKSLVDLGCLEGGFTAEFARLGLEATGIEVREQNLKNARYLKEKLNLPNLHFKNDDAWNVGAHDPFDVIFCVGLYYHIEDANRFLEVLSDACRKIIFLDTHLAPEDDDHPAMAIHRLSPLTEHEGMRGRWYPEHDLDPDAVEELEALETLKWASWRNKRSFWPTKAALIDAMKRAGFDVVVEGFDTLAGNAAYELSSAGWHYQHNRWMMIGIKLDEGAAAKPRMAARPPRPAPATIAQPPAPPPKYRPGDEPKTLAAVEAENAALREALAAVHASTSWKLTAPLRGLKRSVGG